MTHTTDIISYQKLSNGQFALTIRCCGVASTDYPHTMDGAVAADATQRARSISDARNRCSQLHQQAIDAEAALIPEVGTTVTHNEP